MINCPLAAVYLQDGIRGEDLMALSVRPAGDLGIAPSCLQFIDQCLQCAFFMQGLFVAHAANLLESPTI